MTDSGILLLKYWLEVSADEQTRRLESRIHDPRKKDNNAFQVKIFSSLARLRPRGSALWATARK